MTFCQIFLFRLEKKSRLIGKLFSIIVAYMILNLLFTDILDSVNLEAKLSVLAASPPRYVLALVDPPVHFLQAKHL